MSRRMFMSQVSKHVCVADVTEFYRSSISHSPRELMVGISSSVADAQETLDLNISNDGHKPSFFSRALRKLSSLTRIRCQAYNSYNFYLVCITAPCHPSKLPGGCVISQALSALMTRLLTSSPTQPTNPSPISQSVLFIPSAILPSQIT